MKRGAVLLALPFLLAPFAAAEDPRPAPPRPGLTWEAADALVQKLADIEGRARAKKPQAPSTAVSQAELNSYLNLTLAAQMPPGVSDVDVHLEKDVVEANGVVDLDKIPVKQATTASPWNPLNFLAGRVPVLLRARLTTRDGFGTFEPEEVRLASVPLPLSMLEQIVAQATKTKDNPQGFDILSPFRLPYAAKRLKLQPGKALLEF
jgi:hypothetical protein